MSELRGAGHRDRSGYEYALARELARRRARGCARMMYWTLGVLSCVVLICIFALIAVIAG